MSTNPNTVKSQTELTTTNDGKRSSEVLLATIDELEKLKKENEELKLTLNKLMWLTIIAMVFVVIAFWEK